MPKLLVPLPQPPPLPGQCDHHCDVVEVHPSSPQSKQSYPVQTSASLASTAALAAENYAAYGIGTGEGQVNARGVRAAGGGGEGVPSDGRAAVGGRMHLEPLPRLTAARKTRG